MANSQRKWVCAYGNGRVGEVVTLTADGDCRVRVYEAGAGVRGGRQWAVASFASAMAQADALAGEASLPDDWAEANRD